MAHKPNTNEESPASAPHGWLDLRAADGGDLDGAPLRALQALAHADAPEAEIARAVKRARDHDWGWTPIALVLRTTRKDVVRRFSRAIGHPANQQRDGGRG